jgi:hypothetical protein
MPHKPSRFAVVPAARLATAWSERAGIVFLDTVRARRPAVVLHNRAGKPVAIGAPSLVDQLPPRRAAMSSMPRRRRRGLNLGWWLIIIAGVITGILLWLATQ